MKKNIIAIITILSVSSGYSANMQEQAIEDLSRFIINRAQQEIIDSYIGRLKFKRIYKTLFPETIKFLKEHHLASLSSRLLWQELIKQDFNNILVNILNYKKVKEKIGNIFIPGYVKDDSENLENIRAVVKCIKSTADLHSPEELKELLQLGTKELQGKFFTKSGAECIIEAGLIKSRGLKLLIEIAIFIKLSQDSKREKIVYTNIIHRVFQILKQLKVRISDNNKNLIWKIASIADSERKNIFKTIIHEFTMPVGSYKIKRNSRFYITVNSYLGYSVFRKFLYDEDWKFMPFVSDRSDKAYHSAVFVPIGIELGYSFTEYKLYEGLSFGYFFSLIDLGKPVQTFLKKDEDKFTFKDIISPGVYATIHLWDTPFSLGFGYNYYLFRDNLKAPNDTAYSSEHRALVFLTIDIPLLPLYIW